MLGRTKKAARNVVALLAAALASGCATVRPDYYTPQDCRELRREARSAGSWRMGASAVGAGLAAGGAVAELATDSRGAQVGLAVGAVVLGAVALAAGHRADTATQEWAEACTVAPVP